ncbi:MAG: stalk domain-containing protein, partial [Candidatus Ornithomonoglobus sp.]
FNCWAAYLGMPVKQINSGNVYEPGDFEPVTLTINAGETVWLSQYIDNYREIPLSRSVNIMTDFTIDSGVCDVNVAALRATGTTGDRSNFNPDAAFGSYIRDMQYKGISDGLNEVSADLSYTISDSDTAGKLPVTVYNYYMPEGNTITDWYTHLNPRADEWSYDLCAESDMLAFDYYDPNKKYFYGQSVPENERDDYYHFDINHVDTSVYDKAYGVSKNKYIPNREMNDTDTQEYACNLANYGVIYNYNVEITNTGNKKRYLVYKLATASNNLVYVKDSEGNVINDYVLSKGTSAIRLSDDMTCLPIPAQSTSKYTICVILTPNYPGGMQNALYLADYPSLIETYETERGGIEKDRYFDGREYYRWNGGTLSLSNDREEWRTVQLPQSVMSGIAGNLNEYELKWTGSGYALRPSLYDAGWYEDIKYTYRDMYLLDENFNLVRKQTFGSYPQGFTCANGVYYVKMANSVFRSTTEFQWWDMTQLDLPCWNYGQFSALTQDGKIYLSTDGINFDEVEYKGFRPEYVDSYGEWYYCADGRTLYLSKDALNWKYVMFNNKVKTFEIKDNTVIANGEEARELPELCDTAALKYNGRYVALETPGLLIDNSPYMPVRAISELMGYSVEWNAEDGSVIVSDDNAELVISNIRLINDIAYAPIKEFTELDGVNCEVQGAAVVMEKT